MQLTVKPDELAAAATALDRVAAVLEAAGDDFAAGSRAPAAAKVTASAAGAVRTLVADVRVTAGGLRHIASAYVDTDGHAVGAP